VPVLRIVSDRPGWRVFLCALLVPPILTLISALPEISRTAGDVSIIVGLLGSVVGGIVCGAMLAFVNADSAPGRVVLSILLSGVMFVVCLMLCFFGCAIGSGGRL
jgi:hypothetical protein